MNVRNDRMFNFCVIAYFCLPIVSSNYDSDRQQIQKKDLDNYIGVDVRMNKQDQKANAYLMRHKSEELNRAFAHPEKFPPAQHFFQSRNEMKKSKVYQFIKRMPKGAVLHAHDVAQLQPEWFLNVTRMKNLYAQYKPEKFRFKFSKKRTDPSWVTMKELKRTIGILDSNLLKKFTLIRKKRYGGLNEVWKAFNEIFDTTRGLVSYLPVYKNYLRQVLQNYIEDNIIYVEFRSELNLYDLDGRTLSNIETMRFIQQISDELKKKNNFLGVNIIYSQFRGITKDSLKKELSHYHQLKKKFKDKIIGFDLVGQEDKGLPLNHFKDILDAYKRNTSYYFHAGETNWNGMWTDDNLYDAILLGTKRIGHGYSLVKHPWVMERVVAAGIAVEVSPISNQVLMLVNDLRNHPASYYFANGLPIVITNDDSGFWGAAGLTDDFYMAFMVIANARADMRFLKQLTINSINYSGLGRKQRREATSKLLKQWDKFVHEICNEKNL